MAWPEDLLEDETGCYVSYQSSLFCCTAEMSFFLLTMMIFVVVPFGGLLSIVLILKEVPDQWSTVQNSQTMNKGT